MVDIYLDPVTNDLDLTGNTLRLTKTVQENTRQRVLITLNTNKGEWPFNISFGIPWLKNENNNTQLLGKTSKNIIDSAIKKAILTRQGIVSIEQYSSTLDKVTRRMTVNFKALTETGDIITVTENINI